MAGSGFKTFTTGDVLSAADVNGYLMQGVLVFASAAARTSAIATPTEGMYSYLKDTNATEYYDGSSWIGAPVGDITAVTAGTGISGGGASGDVTITNSMATAIDAKGDLVAGTGADAFSRLAVGANATVLTADSTAATGLKWAAAAGPATGWTLLNAGGTTLSGAATVTVSSLSAKQMLVLVKDAVGTATAPVIYVRPNNLTTAVYNNFGIRNTIQAAYLGTNFNNFSQVANSTGIQLLTIGAVGNGGSGYVFIDTCDQTGTKLYQSAGSGQGAGADFGQVISAGTIAAAAAITSMSLTLSSGTFTSGTVYVYGAN